MLSSAESTLIPESGIQEGSPVLIRSLDGIRRSGRRSTRLTDVDMMLDETGSSMSSRVSKSFTLNGTNLSIINVDQTTMIEHERAKSSVFPRWTRSKSVAAVRVEEDADGIRRSSIFSMVTQRNRRKARSIIRNSTRETLIPENSFSGEKKKNTEQEMELSQISEEQSNSSTAGSIVTTPKQNVKELVIQTRSMLKKGKKRSPCQTNTRPVNKAQNNKPSKKTGDSKPATTRNKKDRKRNQKRTNSEVNEELPVLESNEGTVLTPPVTLENSSVVDSRNPTNKKNEHQSIEKSSPGPLITRRKRKKRNLEENILDLAPIVDANQNISSPSKNKSLVEQSVRSHEQADLGENVVNSATSSLESSSDQHKSNTPFSNVSKRKRPKPNPDKDPKPPEISKASEKNGNETTNSDSEPTLKRVRTRSVSRARQLAQELELLTEKRGTRRSQLSRQASQEHLNATAQEPAKPIPTRNRARPRTRAISESATTAPIEPITTRNRRKSPLRNDISQSKPPSRSRSRTRTRTEKYQSSTTGGTPSRSISIPRSFLSPHSANSNLSTEHVPVYRRNTQQALQLNQNVQNQPEQIPPIPSGEDVYTFDSPSQNSTKTDDNTKKTKGSTTKKRPRLATNMSSRSRKTPVKNHTTVFGTDMGKISSVVKKIGRGPVRKRDEDRGTVANTNLVHTSTLAALVHPLQPSNALNIVPRDPTPVIHISAVAADDDHHFDQEDNNHHDFDEENIPQVELQTPLSPPRVHPQIQRVAVQHAQPPLINTPDKAQPHLSTLEFSPQASSSPWRVQNENILPKTFYFSRSKDMLPSYESDLVVRNEQHQPAVAPQDILPDATEPICPRRTSPNHQHSFVRPSALPPTAVSSAAVFKDIQKSYEQLKATSEMSEKLISAMRNYKSNVHNQTAALLGNDTSAEELIAKFRKYEENMKQTYQKLQQWFQRSQRTLAESMKSIEQTSSLPKTPAQLAVVENFRRNSKRFVTMINDLESAMNDSNIENISPPKPVESSGRPPFKDIILSERNRNDRNRSPLKTLDITNVPPRFSPIKSPLVKASFTSFSGNRTKSRNRFSRLSLVKPTTPSTETEISTTIPAATEKNVIVIADTVLEDPTALNETTKQPPEQNLFGFETDEEEQDAAAEVPAVEPTPVKITRYTLKERLQSVRKLLPVPGRIGSAFKTGSIQHRPQHLPPKIFNSPRRKGKQAIQNAFSASTPLAKQRNLPKPREEQGPNISAIRACADHTMEEDQARQPVGVVREQESPPAAVFDEPEQLFASSSLANVSRTYSRVPRRNVRRKPNIYLVNLGISDDEEEEEDHEAASNEDYCAEAGKTKRRKKAKQNKRKKKTVEQGAEFKNFVSEFNSMCDQVNQYQLVIEKPTIQQPV